MTKEQLLQERYEVIGPWPPNNNCQAGDIVTPDQFTGWHPKDYPHLFRRMHWSEKRNPEDMPKYVKVIKGGDGIPDGAIRPCQYTDEKINGKVIVDLFPVWCLIENILPATEHEYKDYINSNKSK